MSVFGFCAGDCQQERLDLVGADTFDELLAGRARSRAAIDSFQAVAEELTRAQPSEGDWEAEYRRLQDSARRALKAHPDRPPEQPGQDEGSRPVTAWWCPECGGLEAPQPCLGICLWRPVEWVRRDRWLTELECLDAELETEAALRHIMRGVAYVTPREGQWQAGWRALRASARRG
jgi:hypothetical protein